MLSTEELGKADHGIQWGTQLIAHIQEERVFQLLLLLGLGRLHLQSSLGIGHLRHITAHAEIVGHLTVIVQHRHNPEVQVDVSSLLVAEDGTQRL